jgi:hypothetical protein
LPPPLRRPYARLGQNADWIGWKSSREAAAKLGFGRVTNPPIEGLRDGCRLEPILARIAPANAPGVLLDLGQGGVERRMRALLDAGHGLQRMSIRVDDETGLGGFLDHTHRAAKEVSSLTSDTAADVAFALDD